MEFFKLGRLMSNIHSVKVIEVRNGHESLMARISKRKTTFGSRPCHIVINQEENISERFFTIVEPYTIVKKHPLIFLQEISKARDNSTC